MCCLDMGGSNYWQTFPIHCILKKSILGKWIGLFLCLGSQRKKIVLEILSSVALKYFHFIWDHFVLMLIIQNISSVEQNVFVFCLWKHDRTGIECISPGLGGIVWIPSALESREKNTNPQEIMLHVHIFSNHVWFN